MQANIPKEVVTHRNDERRGIIYAYAVGCAAACYAMNETYMSESLFKSSCYAEVLQIHLHRTYRAPCFTLQSSGVKLARN